MKVVSTNIGQAVEIVWRGKKELTGMYKYPVDEPILLGKEDVAKDDVMDRKYHGGLDKACYLYSHDHYKWWKARYPEADWDLGFFGENLTVEGIDESQIRIGAVYRLGDAIVQVTQPRQPCYKLGIRAGNPQIVADFWNAPYPGVYVRVLQEGAVKTGDTMQLLEPATANMTLTEVFSLFTHERRNIEKLQRAVAIPEMAASCRKDLTKRLRQAGDPL
ncbi:MOSC domain-containing protein [Mangrovibacterium marinum]|uniref:MOSC domain-containing protein YiiM n=1 Tax=Mangrovibacterium marinum TaxID=1639118 RepID=A0A2T5C4M6_9BACT|nr:MOSC domain-containing protein [Mangrovibacterium marinum]PTN09816.1 MOSC domain-containing protein YiiM [Mangrovibacterium marinum]